MCKINTEEKEFDIFMNLGGGSTFFGSYKGGEGVSTVEAAAQEKKKN